MTDHHGRTPLHIAAQMGGPEFVEVLLAAGADAQASYGGGHTALHRAEDPETVRLLLSAGADPNAKTSTTERRCTPHCMRTPSHASSSLAPIRAQVRPAARRLFTMQWMLRASGRSWRLEPTRTLPMTKG